MILLSFSSAAKYILSLLLAILGIIPYEVVGPSSDETQDPLRQERTLEQPLAQMNPIPFNAEASFAGIPMTPGGAALIPLRDSHPIRPMNVPACILVETGSKNVPSCEFAIDLSGEKEIIKKVTLVYGEKLEQLLDKEVRIISTGLSQ